MMIKKFILKTFIFILFTFVFYIALLFFWGHYAPSILKPNINYKIGSYGHMYSRLSDVKNYSDIDILFLGSSHAYRGFDTRIFLKHGYKTFNLGSNGQTPLQTKVLLSRYLEILNPTTVIYEVYPITFTIDGVESSLDIIANDTNDLYSFEMVLNVNNIKTYNTYFYGLTCDLLNLNRSFIEPVIKRNDKYIYGGYVEKEIGYFQPTQFEANEITIALLDYQLKSFTEIVHLLKSKNILLILVYAPIAKVNYSRYTNNQYFNDLMREYSIYYNFNEIMSLNDSLHFYDSHHLNQEGVKLFNKKLIEILTYIRPLDEEIYCF